MEFEVLGPLRLRSGKGTQQLGRLQRRMLGVMLVHANSAVSTDRLIQAMWGDTQQGPLQHRLHVHVNRLRQSLSDANRLVLGPGGYQLTVQPGELDAERFETLADEAAEVADHDPDRCADLLRKALELWRGEPYEGFDLPELSAEIQRLNDRRLVALETRYAAELSCGRHELVAGQLGALIEQFPLRERLHELRMEAHYLAGRQADALDAYQHARRVLVDELGVDPGSGLRELEARVLAGEVPDAGAAHAASDPSAATTSPVPPAPVMPSAVVPAQLPRQPGPFIGRTDNLADLDLFGSHSEHASDGDGGDGTDGLLVVISGSAGVGKTALALRWSHQRAVNYPDGQLYVDLRGHGPDKPLAPAEVQMRFLRALGVQGHAIAEPGDERTAQFRSHLANRQLLVLLDNARDVAQVRPLLPGMASALVVVTSRNALTGLTVLDGALRLTLDRLKVEDADALMADRLGERYEPKLAQTLIDGCARLPLALRIAAERIREHPGVMAGQLATEIADQHARLDVLDAGDDVHASLRAVFSWSYRDLDPVPARLFRAFGLHPGNDVGDRALAALLDADLTATRQAVDVLVRAHLVEVIGTGRYRLHDLLWSYATELTQAVDPPAERGAAFRRMCGLYLNTTRRTIETAMARDLDSDHEHGQDRHRNHGPESSRSAASTMCVLADRDEAFQWLDTERNNLILLADAAAQDQPAVTIELSNLLHDFLDVRSYFDCAEHLHAGALKVAGARGEVAAEAAALRGLGKGDLRRARYGRAEQRLHASLMLDRQLADDDRLATGLSWLAEAYSANGRPLEAISHLEQAIELHPDPTDPGYVRLLVNLGLIYQRLGRHEAAFSSLNDALTAAQNTQDRQQQAYARAYLVEVCRDTGASEQALEHGRRALALVREDRNHSLEAVVTTGLGTVYGLMGDPVAARTHHLRALDIAHALDIHDLTARIHRALAGMHADADELTDAARCYRSALAYVVTGPWHEAAPAHAGLGDVLARLGDHHRAAEQWRRARDLYRAVGHIAADRFDVHLDKPRHVGSEVNSVTLER